MQLSYVKDMKMNKQYWTTKEGTEISVDDMTEAHAKNILKMLIRRMNDEDDSELTYGELLDHDGFMGTDRWDL